jgi:hypothetical protein
MRPTLAKTTFGTQRVVRSDPEAAPVTRKKPAAVTPSPTDESDNNLGSVIRNMDMPPRKRTELALSRKSKRSTVSRPSGYAKALQKQWMISAIKYQHDVDSMTVVQIC